MYFDFSGSAGNSMTLRCTSHTLSTVSLLLNDSNGSSTLPMYPIAVFDRYSSCRVVFRIQVADSSFPWMHHFRSYRDNNSVGLARATLIFLDECIHSLTLSLSHTPVCYKNNSHRKLFSLMCPKMIYGQRTQFPSRHHRHTNIDKHRL